MGDPQGIGPEVVVKALADPALRERADFVVFGLEAPMADAAAKASVAPFWGGAKPGVTLVDHPSHARASVAPVGERRPTAEGGEASFAFVEAAISAARLPKGDPRRVDAIVTAPISKQAWALAGHTRWPGHTELFAERLGARRTAMFFASPRLRVVLATMHLPLMRVGQALTTERILDVIELGAGAAARLGCGGGRSAPRIAICGLNPHAGEGGLLGDEDAKIVAPAVEQARHRGIDALGPFPADTVFIAAERGDFDLVVAMYHDQGLIPVKLLGWDRAVNATIGLPLPRTSPDHGTAFDIGGMNRADAGSMRAAIDLAIRWSAEG